MFDKYSFTVHSCGIIKSWMKNIFSFILSSVICRLYYLHTFLYLGKFYRNGPVPPRTTLAFSGIEKLQKMAENSNLFGNQKESSSQNYFLGE